MCTLGLITVNVLDALSLLALAKISLLLTRILTHWMSQTVKIVQHVLWFQLFTMLYSALDPLMVSH